MEGSVSSDTLASQQFRSNTESVTTPDIQTQYGSGDLSMNDLKVCLNEFVSVEDLAGSNSKCDSKDSDESGDNLPDSTSSAVSFSCSVFAVLISLCSTSQLYHVKSEFFCIKSILYAEFCNA